MAAKQAPKEPSSYRTRRGEAYLFLAGLILSGLGPLFALFLPQFGGSDYLSRLWTWEQIAIAVIVTGLVVWATFCIFDNRTKPVLFANLRLRKAFDEPLDVTLEAISTPITPALLRGELTNEEYEEAVKAAAAQSEGEGGAVAAKLYEFGGFDAPDLYIHTRWPVQGHMLSLGRNEFIRSSAGWYSPFIFTVLRHDVFDPQYLGQLRKQGIDFKVGRSLLGYAGQMDPAMLQWLDTNPEAQSRVLYKLGFPELLNRCVAHLQALVDLGKFPGLIPGSRLPAPVVDAFSAEVRRVVSDSHWFKFAAADGIATVAALKRRLFEEMSRRIYAENELQKAREELSNERTLGLARSERRLSDVGRRPGRLPSEESADRLPISAEA